MTCWAHTLVLAPFESHRIIMNCWAWFLFHMDQSGQKISGKLNNTFCFGFFFFPSPHCPLPLLFLSIPAPPFSSIPGFKEIRKLELGVKDGFKKTVILCISVNLSRVSDKMWAAELWKEQTSVTSSVPSFCSCLFWALSHQLCARHEDSGGTNQRWLPSSWSTYSGVWWVEQTKKSAHTKCHKLS